MTVGADGKATVVWAQSTNPYDASASGAGPSNPNIWARHFDGFGWQSAVRIGADLADYEGCERPRAVSDEQGRTFAVWEEHKLNQNRIASARFDPGGSWTVREVLDSSTSPVDHRSFPEIATSGTGGAFAVWQADSTDGGTTGGISARLDPSAGWGVAGAFEGSAEVQAAIAAMDGIGNAWAIFGTAGLFARRQDAAGNWNSAQSLGSITPTAVDAP